MPSAESSDNDLDEPRPKKIKQEAINGMAHTLSEITINFEQMKSQIEEIRLCVTDNK